MKFVIYNVENCRTRENRVGKRSIRFNSVTGNMYLSTKLAKEMNITMNDRLEFGCDENNPKEWFLHKTTDKRGFPLQFNRGGTRLRNKYICKTILDIAKVKESATFLVSKDPVKTELGPFYRIILSCPILPKNNLLFLALNIIQQVINGLGYIRLGSAGAQLIAKTSDELRQVIQLFGIRKVVDTVREYFWLFAFGAGLTPAIKAARIRPIEALRAE